MEALLKPLETALSLFLRKKLTGTIEINHPLWSSIGGNLEDSLPKPDFLQLTHTLSNPDRQLYPCSGLSGKNDV